MNNFLNQARKMKNKFLTFLLVAVLPIAVVAVVCFGISKSLNQTASSTVSTVNQSQTAAGSVVTRSYSSTSPVKVGASATPVKSTRVS